MSRSEPSLPRESSSIRRHVVPRAIAFTLAGVLLAACTPGEADDMNASPGEGQAALVFPVGPGDTCALGVPLTCPTSFTFDHAASTFTSQRVTDTRSFTAIAKVRPAALNCALPADVVFGGIRESSGILPPGVRPIVSADGKTYHFSVKSIDGGRIDPPSFSPGTRYCGGTCGNQVDLKDCDQVFPPPSTIHTAFISAAGYGTTTVASTSSVDHIDFDSATGRFTAFCKITIPAGSAAARARPNDVIAASGPNFIRGYDLSAVDRNTACSNLATQQCAQTFPGPLVLGPCITSVTQSCLKAFLAEDPCAPAPACVTPCRVIDNDLVCGRGQMCDTTDLCCHTIIH